MAGTESLAIEAGTAEFYRSLARRMVLALILVSFTPLILISAVIGYHFHTSYQGKVLAHLEELVQKHKQSIDSFLYERLAGIQFVARTFDFEQLRNESFLLKQLTLLREEYGGVFVDLGLVNQQGVQVAYAGPFELREALYSNADWFKRAMQSPIFISDVFTGLRGRPHFIVTVKQANGNREWILRATIDFPAFNSLVEATQIGTTGTAFIVNRAGELQTRPRFEAAFHLNVLKEFLAKNKLQQRVAVFEQTDPAGRKFIYVMTPLKKGEWILVYEQDEADAYSDLYRARWLSIAIILLGGCGITGTAMVLSRRMVHRVARADREKAMMNEQVIEAGKLASVGELAAGIAHEINNPVAIMVEEAGWVEDLLQDEECQKAENLHELKRAVRQIQSQGKRCKEITHKLLSFARRTDPKVKEVMLNDLVQEIVALCEQRARYSGVQIKTALMPDLPHIVASPSEMQQVLLNLINNAVDAMEKSGGTIEVTTRLDGQFVVLDVADTGPGIPQANLGRIFDPFFTTKAVGKGTGLGLSICFGIVHKMGGEISVNSTVGVSTVFHIRIPRPKQRIDA